MDRVLQALLRTELRFFIRKVFTTVSPGETYLHNWHVDAIAHQLMRVRSGESRRLLINQPPRSLKSICVSVAYVAWLLGHDPTRHVIVASYSGDFAAELHRQFRMVIASEWCAAVFPNLHLAKETGLEVVTSQGGSRYATSVGGTLTGRGADLIIVDDPLNANEVHSETARKRVIDWYGGALVSRLNDKQTGSIIAVMQRLHEDDLAGHLLRQGGWNHLNMLQAYKPLANWQGIARQVELDLAVDVRGQAGSVTSPTLVINCAHDQIVTQTYELAASIP